MMGSTFKSAWSSSLKVHENIGGQRIKFAADIIEVADDLQLLVKDTEKARKLAKDAALKQEKSLADAEGMLEKVTRTKHTHRGTSTHPVSF
jgi:hypothetical protein